MNTPPVSIRPIPFDQTYALRHTVLWPDQPPAYVHLDDDPTGYHFGAFYQDELVAVISLFVQDGTGRFRKFATRPDRQRQGIGTRLLHHVMAEARRLGATTLWCDARLDTADFYRKFGMQPEGHIFYKGDIPYTRMRTSLHQPCLPNH
ncbi:MAG: GNAT family N-acetyltransferase [Bacteroidetes bacterium]|nr:GNAT family N-acetyltransferase [Fibrella sp.]